MCRHQWYILDRKGGERTNACWNSSPALSASTLQYTLEVTIPSCDRDRDSMHTATTSVLYHVLQVPTRLRTLPRNDMMSSTSR